MYKRAQLSNEFAHQQKSSIILHTRSLPQRFTLLDDRTLAFRMA